MREPDLSLPIGKQVSLPGHFDESVILEEARPLGNGYECRVRLPDGRLEEAVISLGGLGGLATYMTVSRSTLCHLAQQGRLPGVKAGRHWRFHNDGVDTWLKGRPINAFRRSA